MNEFTNYSSDWCGYKGKEVLWYAVCKLESQRGQCVFCLIASAVYHSLKLETCEPGVHHGGREACMQCRSWGSRKGALLSLSAPFEPHVRWCLHTSAEHMNLLHPVLWSICWSLPEPSKWMSSEESPSRTSWACGSGVDWSTNPGAACLGRRCEVLWVDRISAHLTLALNSLYILD